MVVASGVGMPSSICHWLTLHKKVLVDNLRPVDVVLSDEMVGQGAGRQIQVADVAFYPSLLPLLLCDKARATPKVGLLRQSSSYLAINAYFRVRL